MTPLVSVITPTWQRPSLLLDRCIPSVLAQDYPAVEHIIVSDGPDEYLADLLPLHPSQRFIQLPEHKGARWGHWCRLAGIEAARGQYVAWLDDDNSFRPDHLSRLVPLLEAGAGFAYSQVLFHAHGGNYVVGSQPPRCAQIDTSAIANLKSLHETVTWRDEGQDTIEWDLVDRWMQAGVSWAFDEKITADYYFAGVT